MQFTSISFEKLFPTGAYMNEKIRVDVSLNLGDNAMEAIDEARKLVNENFEKNNPHLVTPDIPIIPKSILEVASIKEYHNHNQQAAQQPLTEQIKSCTDLKVLESYKFIVKGKPELELAYQNKLKELNEQRS